MVKPSILPPITHAQLNCAQQKIKPKSEKNHSKYKHRIVTSKNKHTFRIPLEFM